MRFPLAAVLLLLATALAGCVSDDPEPVAPGNDPSTGGSGSSAPPPGAASGGNSGGSGTTPGTGTNASAPVPMGDPVVTEDDGNFAFKAHPLLGPPVAAGNASDQFRISFDQSAGFILILEWTPSSALTQELGIWARKSPGDSHSFHANGQSPLVLVMPGAESSGGSYLVDILPTATPRVGVNQGFSYTLASFVGVPFNPDWRPAV